MDVNGEVKFCENSKKKKIEGGGWVRGVSGGGVLSGNGVGEVG